MANNDTNKAWSKVIFTTFVVSALILINSFDIVTIYQFIVFLLIIVAIIFLAVFIKNAIKNHMETKQLPSRIIQILAIFIITCTTLLLLYRHGAFYGSKVIDATFLDDRSREDLALFEDGHYILKSGWMLGEELFTGTYERNDSIITLNKYPGPDNNFITKSMTIKGSRIYFQDNTTDSSFYHFKIND